MKGRGYWLHAASHRLTQKMNIWASLKLGFATIPSSKRDSIKYQSQTYSTRWIAIFSFFFLIFENFLPLSRGDQTKIPLWPLKNTPSTCPSSSGRRRHLSSARRRSRCRTPSSSLHRNSSISSKMRTASNNSISSKMRLGVA